MPRALADRVSPKEPCCTTDDARRCRSQFLIFLQCHKRNSHHQNTLGTSMKFASAAVLGLLAGVQAFVSQQQPTRLLSTELFGARKPFITGNWKMNPKTKQEALELAKGVADAVTDESPGDVAIFVPYPFIECVQKCVGDKLIVGAEVILH
jgi:Triosephosphate isomerase